MVKWFASSESDAISSVSVKGEFGVVCMCVRDKASIAKQPPRHTAPSSTATKEALLCLRGGAS